MRHYVREVTIWTSPLDALESVYRSPRDATCKFTAWLMHRTNLYALPTSCRHILPIFFFFFFFEYFVLRGIFFQNRGKKHTFWRWEWGCISAPKTAEKKHCSLTLKTIASCLLKMMFLIWTQLNQIMIHYEYARGNTLEIKISYLLKRNNI